MSYKISRFLEYLFLPIGYLLALPILIIVRLLSRWVIIRWACLISPRIGHFAANTELYCCERDQGINTPSIRHINLFWLYPTSCNQQLKKMWKRHLTILPRILMHPLNRLNEKLNYIWPSNGVHDIGCGKYIDGQEILYPPHSDRDIHNLLDKTRSHLNFTKREKSLGKEGLRRMGIPPDANFVCMILRDSAYLNTAIPHNNWDYHDYRNVDINNFVLASETLAELGYFVIRMGHHVESRFPSKHSKIIDYATNGMRNDIMDIYLGANCKFCITTSTGYDAVPNIFRRPMVYTGYIPFGHIHTSSEKYIVITRHYFSKKLNRELSMQEVLNSEFVLDHNKQTLEKNKILIIENTPEEIRYVVVEMKDRLENKWYETPKDMVLQNKFRELFINYVSSNKNGQQLHGKLKARYGSNFLRDNNWWLN